LSFSCRLVSMYTGIGDHREKSSSRENERGKNLPETSGFDDLCGRGALLPKWTALGVKTKFEATCKMVRSDWPRRWYRGGRPGLHRRGFEWGLPDCIAVARRTASSRDALNAPDCMQSPAMAVPPLAARVGRQGGGTSAGVAQEKRPTPPSLRGGTRAMALRDGVPAGGDPPSGLKPKP